MKTFKDFISEMESAIPANFAGDSTTTDQRLAGLGDNPPVKKKNKKALNKSIFRRTEPKS